MLSRISGMEWWNGTLEWSTGMESWNGSINAKKLDLATSQLNSWISDMVTGVPRRDKRHHFSFLRAYCKSNELINAIKGIPNSSLSRIPSTT